MREQGANRSIILTRQAEKALQHLPKAGLRRIDQAILSLAENPYPLESRALAAAENLYRLRVADWRIIYAVEAEPPAILILEIAARQQPGRD